MPRQIQDDATPEKNNRSVFRCLLGSSLDLPWFAQAAGGIFRSCRTKQRRMHAKESSIFDLFDRCKCSWFATSCRGLLFSHGRTITLLEILRFGAIGGSPVSTYNKTKRVKEYLKRKTNSVCLMLSGQGTTKHSEPLIHKQHNVLLRIA
jgi:hypothetical protein